MAYLLPIYSILVYSFIFCLYSIFKYKIPLSVIKVTTNFNFLLLVFSYLLFALGYQRPSPKFPIISSGFQRFSSTSFGTGFQVALSTLHSSLMVSVQTQTMLTEAIFQNHGRMDAWNDYKFVWKAQSNTLSMYINGTVVSTATGQQHIPKAVNHPMNFINFGGFYDQLSSYSQNFKIRDLKIWKRSLNMDEINSQNIKG